MYLMGLMDSECHLPDQINGIIRVSKSWRKGHSDATRNQYQDNGEVMFSWGTLDCFYKNAMQISSHIACEYRLY